MCCPLLATCLPTGLRGCYCGSSCERRGAAAVLKTERQHKHYADHRCKARAFTAETPCTRTTAAAENLLLQKNFADHRCKAIRLRKQDPMRGPPLQQKISTQKKPCLWWIRFIRISIGMQLHPLYTCESCPTRTPFFSLGLAGDFLPGWATQASYKAHICVSPALASRYIYNVYTYLILV